jgi:hypothetical protein
VDGGFVVAGSPSRRSISAVDSRETWLETKKKTNLDQPDVVRAVADAQHDLASVFLHRFSD